MPEDPGTPVLGGQDIHGPGFRLLDVMRLQGSVGSVTGSHISTMPFS